MKSNTDLYVELYEHKLKKKAAEPKIVRYFPEVFMGNGHNGLSKIAIEHDIDISRLDAGEYVVFMNKAQTALKMFTMGRVIAHLKMPKGTRIDPRVIALLPRFFSGKSIDYNSAIKKVLEAEFRK